MHPSRPSRAAFAAATLAALGGAIPARAQTPAKIVVTWGSIVTPNLPVWLAYETGLFKAHGLDVEMQFQASATQVASLLANQIQFAQVGGGEVASANGNGGDLVVLGVLSPVIPYLLMVPNEIKTPAQLKGKKIGISRYGDATEVGSRIALQKMGIDPSEVTFLQLGSNAVRTAALINGAVQATVTIPPSDLELAAHGLHAIFSLAPLKIPAPDVSITVRRSWAAAHPELVQAYIDAVVEGYVRMKRDRGTGVAVLKTYFKSDDEKAMGYGYDILVREIQPGLPYPTPLQFKATIEELGKTNPGIATVDPAKMIDDSYMRRAAARYKAR